MIKGTYTGFGSIMHKVLSFCMNDAYKKNYK